MRSIWSSRSDRRTEGSRVGNAESDGVAWDALVPVAFGVVIGAVVWFAMDAYEGGYDLATGISFAIGAWLLCRWLLTH
jgi:hypothetical protein